MSRILLIVGIVLFVLWALGFLPTYYLGGYVNIFLVIALLSVIVWLVMNITRRRR